MKPFNVAFRFAHGRQVAPLLALFRRKDSIRAIEPHPTFYSQWIFENLRAPDPLLKLRELIKDLKFMKNTGFTSFKFNQAYKSLVEGRIKDELNLMKLEAHRDETKRD